MKSIADLQVRTSSITSTLDMLKNNGIAVIPDYLSEESLSKLNDEFKEIQSGKYQCNHISKMDYSKGVGIKVKLDKTLKMIFPETSTVFQSEYMKTITENYLDHRCTFNDEIYVVKDVFGSSHHANDMHFDVIPAFKFFIYLTDTTTENGAFTIIPDSISKTQSIRKKHGKDICFKNRHLSRQLDFKLNEVLPIEGTAGTLIIFNTEVWHKAGIVKKGDRRVMRGHCVKKCNQPFKKRYLPFL